jgi:hypothetical protein
MKCRVLSREEKREEKRNEKSAKKITRTEALR